jgi:transcriptional regulator with XRE-family HTH domain
MRCMTHEEVREIRGRMQLSREELAQKMGLTAEAIRAWESGKNPCEGPSAILLRLLDRHPQLLDRLDAPRLPRCDPPDGSVEWFEVQRILGLMNRAQNYREWSEIVATWNLDADWLDTMERALLLSRSPTAERAYVTGAAEIKFRLRAWSFWYGKQSFSRRPPRPADVPLLPRAELDQLAPMFEL